MLFRSVLIISKVSLIGIFVYRFFMSNEAIFVSSVIFISYSNERPTGQKNIIAGTTVENKGKLILTEIFPSVQNRDIF